MDFSNIQIPQFPGLKEHKKAFVIAGLVGVISGTVITASAAIPVHDDSNLLKIMDVLEKTEQIIDKATEQLNIEKLMNKNINTVMEKYNTYVTKHINDLDSMLSKAGGYLSQAEGIVDDATGKVETYTSEKYLKTQIPEISIAQKDGKIVINSQSVSNAYANAQGSIIQNNQNILDAQKHISEQMKTARTELQELMKKNADLGETDGILAAQQINNQIKALEAYISSLLVEQQALAAQATALRDQAEAQRAQNQALQNQAISNAIAADREEKDKFYSSYRYVRVIPFHEYSK